MFSKLFGTIEHRFKYKAANWRPIAPSFEKCFLCGTTENLTRDHVPPKSFYKPPLPDNLLTVTACRNCNNSYSLDEEYFRVCVATQGYWDEIGKWIWENKVIESSFHRSPLLKKNIVNKLVSLPVYSPTGQFLGNQKVVLYDVNRINRVLDKIVRALFTAYHPTVDLTDVEFTINLSRLDQELASCLKKMKRESSGRDTFIFWRGFTKEEPRKSIWYLMFYKQTIFAITTKPKNHSISTKQELRGVKM